MKASILDLRYKMKDVLKALDRNESVEILYHGKKKGVISPYRPKKIISVCDHEFFGSNQTGDVSDVLNDLRKGRFDDI